jgi:hypothetical protein
MSSEKERMRSRTLSQSMGFGQCQAHPRAMRLGSEVWTLIASQICKSIQWWPFAFAPRFLVSVFFCIRRSKTDFEGFCGIASSQRTEGQYLGRDPMSESA